MWLEEKSRHQDRGITDTFLETWSEATIIGIHAHCPRSPDNNYGDKAHHRRNIVTDDHHWEGVQTPTTDVRRWIDDLSHPGGETLHRDIVAQASGLPTGNIAKFQLKDKTCLLEGGPS
jgi:hypothetical protein